MITKKIFRVQVQRILRNLHVLKPVEQFRYVVKRMRLQKRNKKFVAQYPGFALPPPHLAFDAYSSSHWEFYKVSGELTAKFLTSVIENHFSEKNPLHSIYEWGCGPARVIRQLPPLIKSNVSFHASDYNPETISWCRQNIPGIQFEINGLHPPLPYEESKFDFIYAISVFTHLSEDNGLAWANELYRVMKPGGVLLITTSGDKIYQHELLPDERKKYDAAGIVVRDKYEEGKKMFLAMHSPRYVREKLLNRFEILEHAPSMFPFMTQDYWIAKKIQ